MELKNIKTINLPDIVKELEMMKIDYTNSLQIIEEFGSDNDQAVYVGSLIYGLEAPKDFTFTITKNNYTIVDGMKRLNAIMLFIK
ncbi:hypothetical protein [Paenibacillus pini]|uniref:DUF262 domain-containing protein n=1 Tax=Paenibacillus pini JCM 16418 TaxID=1236976 RepID=W7YUF4_9BACL|nr:hypothetical protein [Paenibacillus pini]GAF10858.1 hypothetical protein JCM16418_5085 [Paenibacillus pini JCM 16418]